MKILVCGTRSKIKGYKELVWKVLDPILKYDIEIIEGCCSNSADAYAEEWAKDHLIKVNHFPSTSGNYLKRNIEMVAISDKVIAFWDNFSYGTAHTIAHAVKKGIPTLIIDLKKELK